MSTEQTRRVIEAIKECEKIVSREYSYVSEHRNTNLITETLLHKSKLEGML